MASRKPAVRKPAPAGGDKNEVDDFMRKLEHPLKAEIELLRSIILGVSPKISEGIKWNAPSFRSTEYFATFHLRAKDGIQLIFHLGAKVKDNSRTGLAIKDPSGLLEWLAAERCTAKFRDRRSIEAGREALADIVRQWIAQMQ